MYVNLLFVSMSDLHLGGVTDINQGIRYRGSGKVVK